MSYWVVEGSINYDSQKRFFDMKLSGVTLEDGKPYTEVVCIGNYSDKRMYISNQELEKEIMNRESAKGMEKLDEWLNMMKEKTERLKKEAELERRRWRN